MDKVKGILIPIGGGEDKEGEKEVLKRIVQESGKPSPKVEVITIATSLPEEVGGDYISAFSDIGLKNVNALHIEEREQASSEEVVKRLKECDVVLFSGGNQLKLTSLLGGTGFLEVIKERYKNDKRFIVAGTSAGAAAMSNTMIVSGSSKDALIKGELQLTNGLDFINNVFIDTHFTQRGRFGRLIQTVAANPGILGIGLGEDTGAVIYGAETVEIIGSGLVVIMDGKDITYTDLVDVEVGQPITVEGLKMHVITSGKKFSLTERRLINEKE